MADDYADLLTQQAALARRQKLLDALQAQGANTAPIQGNGGIAAVIQALARVGSGVAAGAMQPGQDKAMNAYQDRYSAGLSGALDAYLSKKQGVPSALNTNPMGPPTEEGVPPAPVGMTPAVPGNPQGAVINAIASRYPELQKIGMTDLAALDKGQEKFGTPLPAKDADGNPVLIAHGDRGTVRTISGYTPEGKPIVVNDKIVDASGKVPVVRGDFGTKYGPLEAVPGADGRPDLAQKADSGKYVKFDNAPKVNVTQNGAPISIGKGENKFWETVGGNLGDKVKELATSAETGYRTKNTVAQLRELDAKGVYSGSGAGTATMLNGVAAALGLPGVDEAKLANSQTFRQQIAQSLSGNLTNSSLARSTTDNDIKIIQQGLPQMETSAVARKQVYDALERSANRAIARHSSAQQQLLNEAPENYKGPLRLNLVDQEPGPGITPNTVAPTPGAAAGSGVIDFSKLKPR